MFVFGQDLYNNESNLIESFWEGPTPHCDDIDCIEVPVTPSLLSHQQLVELKQTVDPLEQCDDLGVSLYVAARTFVRACF